jgi:hypothetical protein
MLENGEIVVQVMPEPLVKERTSFVPAGVVTFGVEVRSFEVDRNYIEERIASANESDAERLRADNADLLAGNQAPYLFEGPSIHVFGSADNHEYLRFDLFENDAHYHCLSPATPSSVSTNRVVPIDTTAVGDLVPWAMHALRQDLAPMLKRAGGDDLAERLDQDSVLPALDIVQDLAEKVGSIPGDA